MTFQVLEKKRSAANLTACCCCCCFFLFCPAEEEFDDGQTKLEDREREEKEVLKDGGTTGDQETEFPLEPETEGDPSTGEAAMLKSVHFSSQPRANGLAREPLLDLQTFPSTITYFYVFKKKKGL